jgi:hypothetical protein
MAAKTTLPGNPDPLIRSSTGEPGLFSGGRPTSAFPRHALDHPNRVFQAVNSTPQRFNQSLFRPVFSRP